MFSLKWHESPLTYNMSIQQWPSHDMQTQRKQHLSLHTDTCQIALYLDIYNETYNSCSILLDVTSCYKCWVIISHVENKIKSA